MFNDEGLGAAMGQWAIEEKADEAKAAATVLEQRVDFLEKHLIALQAHVIRLGNELMSMKK